MERAVTPPIAIIGAAGFVGSRLIETCILSGITNIHPIVRNNYNLARLCRYGVHGSVRIADAENEKQLLEVIKGSPVVVNLVSSDPIGIVESTKAIHKACIESGAKRLIHLSSAAVYGQVESSQIHDDSPFETNHLMPYARAKIRAENFLRRVSGLYPLEVIILRPGIVWGPRSRWSFNAAGALNGNSAFIVGDGSGICNTIYVDNLVASVLKCCAKESDASGSYNVADDEVVTWREFYASLADFLGYDISFIPKVPSDRFKPTFDSMLLDIKSTALYNKFKKRITQEKREMIKQWLSALQPTQGKPQTKQDKHQPTLFVSREMWNLQKTHYKLPTTKFAAKFNFTPPVSFHHGTQMTINWLKFLGFG